MKILDRNKPLSESQSIEERSQFLVESFNRVPNKKTFLNENGNNEANSLLFDKLCLLESMQDPKAHILFECGIKIPSIGSKLNPELSIRRMFENSNNEEEFVQLVESKIMKPCFDALLTESDKEQLQEAYKEHRS